MAKKRNEPIKVNVKSADGVPQKGLQFYLFGSKDELLESVPIKEGKAVLKTGIKEVKGKSRVLIGPALPKEFKGRQMSPLLIKKMGGYEPSIRVDLKNEINITRLPKIVFPIWDWCLITGSLSKTFNIDGEDQVLPVCDARVHICEIDRIRWWWPLIPRPIITDLADKLKEFILRPKLEIPPIPDPGPQFSSITGKSIFPRNKVEGFKSISAAQDQLVELPEQVKKGLLSNSTSTVHDTIFKNFHLLHPYLCLWPWYWPFFYRCTEIATVYSDCNGNFDFNYLNFTNDKDIYIWVEVNIDGEWVTVYKPPIPCYTHWDYDCGTDIDINITDPRVLPCSCEQQLEGELVWFRSIGQHATALHIQQNDSSTVPVQGVNLRNVGCTDIHHSNQINPFGSTLYFKLLFGDGLPKTGITHYRWTRTQLKNATLNNVLTAPTTVVKGTINKHYFVITTDTNGHMHFQTKFVTLGAEGSGENIGYRIPHWDIYDDPGVPAAHKALTIQWTSPDFWSAAMDSTDLADGLWRFDLELLRRDSAGVFHVVDVPKQVFQVSDYNNSGDSVNAPDNYLNIQAGNARNLEVKVRIDNNRCNADIQDVELAGSLSGRCGFLRYNDLNDPVKISYIASHINNFATFGFSVIKGNNTEAITPTINENGYVISSTPLYTLSGGVFSNTFPVSRLVGTCPQAAFAERLRVYALATNGTHRLEQYDDSDTNAFALSNS